MSGEKPLPAYKLKAPKAVEKTVVDTYKKIERGVTGAYRAIEDKFVETFLEKSEEPEKK